jgi:cysteine desulfurase
VVFFIPMQRIFLDNNATTLLDSRVKEVMLTELDLTPSNPSSIHSLGRAARGRLIRAREGIASYLNIAPQEMVFTSGGTEALNLAILGIGGKGTILSSEIEHAAVYETLKRTHRPISYLPVDRTGHVRLENVKKNLELGADLIVLGGANSETGVKNPIDAIAELALHYQVPFIVDGVALLGKESFTIPEGVTAMAFSGHKLHGPQGSGFLYVKKKTPLSPLLTGGGQEFSRRSGTENLAAIIGLAKAVELLEDELPQARLRMEKLRTLLEEGLKEIARVNGSGPRICNTTNLFFSDRDAEGLLIQLDQKGIAVSMGSACSSGAIEPSRVLIKMGLSSAEARASLRFSLSRFTTEEEIQTTVKTIRSLS